jgi:Ser/Thr protein kinase RdoA (MazF antagonist)
VCQQLTQLGIPDTLVHGDLSPRNIYIRDRGFVYFDWSDTCISHPFFDLIRFLYEIEKDLPHVPDARSRIRNAYLEPWTIYAPMSQLISTFELVSETLVSLYEIIRDRLLRENGRNSWQGLTETAVPFYLQRLLIQVATYLEFSQNNK